MLESFSYRVFGYTGETSVSRNHRVVRIRFSYRVFGYTGET